MNLISDLLDIPRIETGQLVQEMKDFSLKELLKRCLTEQRTLAREKGLALKTEVPDKLGGVYGSPPRIQQVLTNLVTNAIHYTDPGGQVIVTLEPDETDPDRRVVCRVSDTGIGIKPEAIEHVFEPFFRADEKVAIGTGLGLTIAREIVRLHGGDIVVESVYGEGSTFEIMLDVVAES